MTVRLFHFEKHPGERAQLTFGFAAYLAEGETIASKVVSAPAAIDDAASDVVSGSDVLVWISGGTAGVAYRVACTITTSAGRVEPMECDVRVVQP